MQGEAYLTFCKLDTIPGQQQKAPLAKLPVNQARPFLCLVCMLLSTRAVIHAIHLELVILCQLRSHWLPPLQPSVARRVIRYLIWCDCARGFVAVEVYCPIWLHSKATTLQHYCIDVLKVSTVVMIRKNGLQYNLGWFRRSSRGGY